MATDSAARSTSPSGRWWWQLRHDPLSGCLAEHPNLFDTFLAGMDGEQPVEPVLALLSPRIRPGNGPHRGGDQPPEAGDEENPVRGDGDQAFAWNDANRSGPSLEHDFFVPCQACTQAPPRASGTFKFNHRSGGGSRSKRPNTAATRRPATALSGTEASTLWSGRVVARPKSAVTRPTNPARRRWLPRTHLNVLTDRP